MSRYFKRHKWALAAWMGMELVSALAMVYWAHFMKGLSDTAFGGEGLAGIRRLLLFGLAFLVLYLLSEYGALWCRGRFQQRCSQSLKDDLFHRIIHQDITAFSSANSARYISLLNNDTAAIDQYVFGLLPRIAAHLIMLTVAALTMLYFHPLIALVCVALNLLPILPATLFGKQASGHQKEHQEALEQFNADVKDMFTGFEVVKSFHAEAKMEERFRRSLDWVEESRFRTRKEKSRAMAVGSTLTYFTGVLQLVFSAYLVMTGEITMGILLGATQISNQVANPARMAIDAFLEYRTVKPVVSRILEVLDGSGESGRKVPAGQTHLPAAGDIRVDGLTFSYEEGREVLHGLSCAFRPGGKYAVVGGSGSGKSTLIRLLMGYYFGYGGSIRYNGIPMEEIERASLYQRVSMIHQKVFLFDDTLRDNITMFQPYPDELVWQAVRDAGLTEVAERMGGLDARVEENGRNLSGGEQQRVSIARAFLRGTEVMLVDEATASLDPQTAAQIHRTLMAKEGLTLIAVTHRTDRKLLEDYDEVLVLEQGVLLERGSYGELSPQRRRLLELQ